MTSAEKELKWFQKKLREAKNLPADFMNRKDIIRQWELEVFIMKRDIEYGFSSELGEKARRS